MKSYSLTDLSNRSGEIAEAAKQGPVAITNRGKRQYVLLTAEQYDAFSKPHTVRRVLNMEDLSPEDADFYLRALSKELEELEAEQ